MRGSLVLAKQLGDSGQLFPLARRMSLEYGGARRHLAERLLRAGQIAAVNFSRAKGRSAPW